MTRYRSATKDLEALALDTTRALDVPIALRCGLLRFHASHDLMGYRVLLGLEYRARGTYDEIYVRSHINCGADFRRLLKPVLQSMVDVANETYDAMYSA